MKTENELTPKQWQLANAMSAISEECYAAGWLSGLEYTLWRFITYEESDARWGWSTIETARLDNLRTLALDIGGWIVWDDDLGEVFLTFDEWKQKHQMDNKFGDWPWRMIRGDQ